MTNSRVLWVTGGGSGMGAATARAAAASGWTVAVSGRRADAADRVVADIAAAGGDALSVPVDVRDPDAVAEAHARIAAERGPVTGLVASAGLNVPNRRWDDQGMDEFSAVVDTNLTAVARAVDAVLPDMRAEGSGRVVVVSSRAGWRFSPGSGVAYMSSKAGLRMLCASLNEQEAASGVTACHLCPGDVATDFLDQRPEVPDAAARSVMLTPDDVARAALFVLDSPAHVRVDELVITPLSQR